MEKYYKFALAALFLIALILFLFNRKSVLAPEFLGDYKTVEIKINGCIINVEIADTAAKRAKGLSGRKSLAENSGMFFVFNRPDYYSFWMKDMNFSLDFIWINGNEIVEITRNVKPEDYQPPNSLVPKNKIDKVLEVNAGVAQQNGIQEGDKLEL